MEKESTIPDELVVVWTSGDREVASKMIFKEHELSLYTRI